MPLWTLFALILDVCWHSEMLVTFMNVWLSGTRDLDAPARPDASKPACLLWRELQRSWRPYNHSSGQNCHGDIRRQFDQPCQDRQAPAGS